MRSKLKAGSTFGGRARPAVQADKLQRANIRDFFKGPPEAAGFITSISCVSRRLSAAPSSAQDPLALILDVAYKGSIAFFPEKSNLFLFLLRRPAGRGKLLVMDNIGSRVRACEEALVALRRLIRFMNVGRDLVPLDAINDVERAIEAVNLNILMEDCHHADE